MYVRKHVPEVRSLFHPRISEALQRLIKESSCLCVRHGSEASILGGEAEWSVITWLCISPEGCGKAERSTGTLTSAPLLNHKAFSLSVFRFHLNF